MIQIEQIRNYFPVQIRGNSSFDKYMLKEYLQLMILVTFLLLQPFKSGFYRGNQTCV